MPSATCRRSKTWRRRSASTRPRGSSSRRRPRKCCRCRRRARKVEEVEKWKKWKSKYFSLPTYFSTFPLLQLFHFVRAQLPPVPRLQPPVRDRAEPDPPQRLHRVPDGIEHAADLAVSPLADGDQQHALLVPAALFDQQDLRRHPAASVQRDAPAQPPARLVLRHAGHARPGGAIDPVPRVRQLP